MTAAWKLGFCEAGGGGFGVGFKGTRGRCFYRPGLGPWRAGHTESGRAARPDSGRSPPPTRARGRPRQAGPACR
jgi:hypothetical protein